MNADTITVNVPGGYLILGQRWTPGASTSEGNWIWVILMQVFL